nr:unnamed protein product [Callosobruchus analis]
MCKESPIDTKIYAVLNALFIANRHIIPNSTGLRDDKEFPAEVMTEESQGRGHSTALSLVYLVGSIVAALSRGCATAILLLDFSKSA